MTFSEYEIAQFVKQANDPSFYSGLHTSDIIDIVDSSSDNPFELVWKGMMFGYMMGQHIESHPVDLKDGPEFPFEYT